jgi:outer membrane immunogenic protein
MRRLLAAATLLLAISGTSLAADYLARPSRRPAVQLPPDTSVYMGWSGFYLGLNGGGGLGNGRSDFSIAGAPAFASINNSLSGAVGGGQAGFNWQAGVTVIGIEADFQASGLQGGLAAPCAAGLCVIPLTASYHQKVPWFGSVRGRLGVSSSGWLMFATVGFAYARLETDAVATAGAASVAFTLHETRHGWTAGGGIEVAFAPGWSAKLEYLYLDLGSESTGMVFAGLPTIVDDAHLTMNVVRAGVNYRF